MPGRWALRRHILATALLWTAITAVGEVAVLRWLPFPARASEQARIIDDAFTVLAVLAVPVLAYVLAVLLYSLLRFRGGPEPTTDGPPVRTHGPFVATWLVVTTALTITLIVFPGAVDLNALRAQEREPVDLVVRVEGVQWAWFVTYPEQGVTVYDELVLPLGRRVRFEVTSRDVVHSFWIPAFRTKVDAVPGMTTVSVVTPQALGDFSADPTFRVQCAELCGLGHALMSIPVRVVTPEQFQEWLAQQASS